PPLRGPARLARGSGARAERPRLCDLPRPDPARDRAAAARIAGGTGDRAGRRRGQAGALWRTTARDAVGAALAPRPPVAAQAPLLQWARMEALAVSTLTVALAEIGDKTQLLALLLAARYRRAGPIISGILVATLLNHALAGWLGALAASWLTPEVLRWVVAASFIAIALWTLKPDKLEDDALAKPARGAFVATCIAFFIAEIGDKTQVATVLLAAHYVPLWQVVAGTTVGMLAANVPVVL